MKQTAVEWLENEFQEICKDFGGLHSDFIVKFDQAKAMEKDQIMSAFFQGDIFGSDYYDGVNPTDENYYNETFKTK